MLIHGTFTTLSPFHSAAFGGGFVCTDEGRLIQGSTAQGKPATVTTKQSVFADGIELAGVPFYPGNALRGLLRREARALIQSVTGQKNSLPVYHGMSCGAVTGKPASGSSVDLEYLSKARQHVFAGLFGGGPEMIASAYTVSDLLPVIAPLVSGEGARTRPIPAEFGAVALARATDDGSEFIRNPWLLTEIKHFLRVDDILRMNIRNLDESIEDFEEQATAWLIRIAANKAARAAVEAQVTAVAGKKRVKGEASVIPEKVSKEAISAMTAVEVVKAGVPFYFRATVEGTEAQTGLLLMALAGYINRQKMGGMTRLGFGRFYPDLVLEQDGVVIGDALEYTDGKWVPHSVHAAPYLNAAMEAISAITNEEMASIYFEASKDESDALGE